MADKKPETEEEFVQRTRGRRKVFLDEEGNRVASAWIHPHEHEPTLGSGPRQIRSPEAKPYAQVREEAVKLGAYANLPHVSPDMSLDEVSAFLDGLMKEKATVRPAPAKTKAKKVKKAEKTEDKEQM